ncbi:MAG TPA: hypothetical protein VLS93_18710 [Anaeromyxobacteraceae bacterium]|nr:hypothetical protein [Anaeromyxobacteraceae bacterium]
MVPPPYPPDRDRLLALKQGLARAIGLPDRRDALFFFLRLGSDWHRYPFSWEPFRELAGSLRPGPASLPVVLVSDGARRSQPELGRSDFPVPHLELRISPECGAAAVARAFLELLAANGALPAGEPAAAFAQGLRIRPEDLGEEGLRFLSS